MAITVDFDGIKTELNNQWNVGIIAKPTFISWLKRDQLEHDTMPIKVGRSIPHPATTGINSRDQIVTSFRIRACAGNKGDADLYLSEVRRIINAKDLTNGHWHVDAYAFFSISRVNYYDIDGSETFLDI